MTRRELLILGKNSFLLLLFGGLLSGCGLLRREKRSAFLLASLLGYLLYEETPPLEAIGKIEIHLRSIARSSLRKRIAFEGLAFSINLKIESTSFETLSPEKKKDFFKEVVPIFLRNSDIFDVLLEYLEGECVLEYLNYPDLPGDFGECGWMVLEGDVWDRYYPPSGT